MTTRNISREWKRFHSPDHFSPDFMRAVNDRVFVAQLLAARQIDTAQQARAFLNPFEYPPTPAQELPDVAIAVDILLGAITTRKNILVWGDFDVDGQTSTALLVDALKQAGAHVSFHIPHRLHDSHGIQTEKLLALITERQPDVLLTCDTGVSAHDAVDHANQRGLTTIITDHHDLPAGDLPAATAIINPKRLPQAHPLRALPGVGVAYKLIEALYDTLGKPAEESSQWLDLVALGIVADVAEQIDDTRYLLQLGMDRLRHTSRTGLHALFDVAKVNPEHLTAEDIGFQIAPRLNALSRLDDAADAVELLTTDDSIRAQVIAARLDGLNSRRRVLQRQMATAAQEMIAANPGLLEHTALVLYQAAWHPGLLGIVAGQLAEQYHKPCILLSSEAAAEGTARGSARSAPGYDIGAAIAAQADILIAHGGHPGAAGLSLPAENIATFRRRVSHTLSEQSSGGYTQVLSIDAEVTLVDITPELVEQVYRLAPFGEGNPPIMLMASDLTLVRHAPIGREKEHRKLIVTDASETTQREVLWWRGYQHPLPTGPFDLAFTVGWNTYRGQREVAITLQEIREKVPDTVLEEHPPSLIETIEDWRQEAPQETLSRFATLEPQGVVWAEGADLDDLEGGLRRDNLPASAEALLIYTVPPSASVLHDVLDTIQVERIYLAGSLPHQQTSPNFRYRLLKLCKNTINHKDGRGDPAKLAAASAQRITAVLWGLRALAAEYAISIHEQEDCVMIAAPGVYPPPSVDEQEAKASLRAVLAEANAYRQFFLRAELSAIMM